MAPEITTTVVLSTGDQRAFPFAFPPEWQPALDKWQHFRAMSVAKGVDWPGDEETPPTKGGWTVTYDDKQQVVLPHTEESLMALADFAQGKVIRSVTENEPEEEAAEDAPEEEEAAEDKPGSETLEHTPEEEATLPSRRHKKKRHRRS